jgi:hypothetical protein
VNDAIDGFFAFYFNFDVSCFVETFYTWTLNERLDFLYYFQWITAIHSDLNEKHLKTREEERK